MRKLWWVSFVVMAGCSEPVDSVGETPEAGAVLQAPPLGQGFQLDMGVHEAPPYEESWICEVYEIPISQVENVNWVEYEQPHGTHHMTLSTTGLFSGGMDVAPGTYDCADLYNDSSLMQDQIMFFGNQGDAQGEIHLPDGVAAPLPSNIKIIHEMHYVNTTDQPVELFSRVNAWTIPPNQVTDGIWGGQIRDERIEIPANSTHSEWSRCVMNEDVDIHFLASHMHELGVEFTIARFDGETTGDVFYTNTDWHDPMIVQYEIPISVPAGSGFEWSCTWDNPSDESVSYGPTSKDEMCNLAIVHTPLSMTALCEVVETSDGVLWGP
jgi:hypothetical protein